MNDKKTKTETKENGQTRVPWNPWLGVVFVIVVYYAAEILAGLMLAIYPGIRHWSHDRALDWLTNSTIAQFFYLVLASGGILAAIHLFLKRYGCTFQTIGLKKPRWRDPMYALIAVPAYYLLYLIAVSVLTHFVPSFNVDQQQQVGFNGVHGALPLAMAFVSLVILPPLTEEIMVRGFLYSSLKKGMKIIPAAILTSLIFAAAHLPEGGAAGPLYIAALDTFILSLVLTYLREKTGSLWASITLHAIKNGIAFVALFVAHAH
ncbi:MAG TPA: CPBP family intramembrane glutamic endopeptidase [Candidatus Saccharimonadales bacterium]|nr:CPBP family intramembrane glutamic endopeptidase [Candidatus Saccharimonadales bacterium]